MGHIGEQTPRDGEGGHDRLVPRAGFRVQQARGGSVGIFHRLLAREQEVQVVGNHKEGVSRLQLLGVFPLQGQQLVDGVEGLTLQTAVTVQLLGGHDGVGHRVHARRATVAVGHGITYQVVVGIQQHEIDAPGVDAHGLGRKAGLPAAGQATQKLAREQIEIPAIVTVATHLAVVEAMDLLKADEPLFQIAHHHAPRRCPDIHRRVAVGSRTLRLLRHSRPISERISHHLPGETPNRK